MCSIIPIFSVLDVFSLSPLLSHLSVRMVDFHRIRDIKKPYQIWNKKLLYALSISHIPRNTIISLPHDENSWLNRSILLPIPTIQSSSYSTLFAFSIVFSLQSTTLIHWRAKWWAASNINGKRCIAGKRSLTCRTCNEWYIQSIYGRKLKGLRKVILLLLLLFTLLSFSRKRASERANKQ